MVDSKMKFVCLLAATLFILLVGGRIVILNRNIPVSNDVKQRFAIPANDPHLVLRKDFRKGSSGSSEDRNHGNVKVDDIPDRPSRVEGVSSEPPSDPEEFEAWAAADLQKRYGDAIQSKKHQAELLGFRKYMMVNYPENWQPKLRRILTSAFSEHADQILGTFAQFDRYQQWFEENAAELGTLDYVGIKTALRNKRREIFGQEALKIWPSSAKEKVLTEILKVLDQARDISLEERLSVYRKAVEDVYGRSDKKDRDIYSHQLASAPAANQSYNTAAIVLNLDAVKEELRVMVVDDGENSRYQIKRRMGISENTFEPFAGEKYRREQQWQKGVSYMAEREALWNVYSGEELTLKLQQLWRRHFENESGALAAEEATDFFSRYP